jgi:putative ubiquitin-RnfH superfamily antitoxin RatB of RatAB toxin-antitoxin module
MSNHKPQEVEICFVFAARALLGTCEYKTGMSLKTALEAALKAVIEADLQGALQAKANLNQAAIEARNEFNQAIEQALKQQLRVGVFGKLRELDDAVFAGDRIEIYRPLQVDPMESRRARAAKKAKKN